MSKHRKALLKVLAGELTVTASAAAHGVSRQHLQRLLRRYRDDGMEAVEPRSRRPLTSPGRTPGEVRERVVALRVELVAAGLDAGPVTIAWHLAREDLPVPSTATIRRILHAACLVVPEPRKRPRSSWTRFEAEAPNGMWQSDMTVWHLADGSEVEILSWLDDHSRFLLGCTAHARVRGTDVVATFTRVAAEHGLPAATLTDNGHIYTTRRRGTPTGFEVLLAGLGVRQRNGAPRHPQTQGKVERFHQTLKRWLGRRPPAVSPDGLQAQLDAFRLTYNEERPHRAIGRRTPGVVYRATPKDRPSGTPEMVFLRFGTVDGGGQVTFHRSGRMHQLAVGKAHRRRLLLLRVEDHRVTVIDPDTGEVLSTHVVEPARRYWRNSLRGPGRWPPSSPDG